MSAWIQEPSFSNSGRLGTVQFSAIKLNPGFVGSKGNIIDITFRVKDTGVADVTFSSGSVLANDGKGSNLLDAFGSAVFSLVKSKLVPSPSPPNLAPLVSLLPPLPQLKYFIQDLDGNDVLFSNSEDSPKWSNSPYAKISWTLPDNTTRVLTLLDDHPDTEPTIKSETITDSQILPLLPEGKHYFHIRFVDNTGAGPVLHFPVFIDLHEPKPFTIIFVNKETTSQGIYSTSHPRPRLTFFTEDELSGLDHYEFKINNGDWATVQFDAGSIFFKLPKLEPKNQYDLVVRAFDLAGNFVDATTTFIIEPVVAPVITYYPRNVRSSAGPLVIEGQAAPDAKIELVLKKNEPIIVSV